MVSNNLRHLSVPSLTSTSTSTPPSTWRKAVAWVKWLGTRAKTELYTNSYLQHGFVVGLILYTGFFAFTTQALAAGTVDPSQATSALKNLYDAARTFLFAVVGLGCGLVVTVSAVLLFTGIFKPQNKEAAFSKLKIAAIAVVLLGWGPTAVNWGIDLMNAANPQGSPTIQKLGN